MSDTASSEIKETMVTQRKAMINKHTDRSGDFMKERFTIVCHKHAGVYKYGYRLLASWFQSSPWLNLSNGKKKTSKRVPGI